MIKRLLIFLILSNVLIATPVKWSVGVTAEAGPNEEEEKKEKEEEKEEKEEKKEEKKEDQDKEKEEESTKEPRESEEEDPKDNKETTKPDNSDEGKESPNNETTSGNTSNERDGTNTNQSSGQNSTGETETRETTSSNETNSSSVTEVQEVHREVQEEVEEEMEEEVQVRTPRNQDPGRFHPYGNYWDEGYDRTNDSHYPISMMDDAYTKTIMDLYHQYKDELNLLDQDIFIFIRTILDGNNHELEEMIKLLDEEFLGKMWNFITKDEMLDLAQTDLLLEFFVQNYNVTLSTVNAFATGDKEGADHTEKEQRIGIIGTIVNFFKSIGLFFTNLF
ncbi:hypothetical protein J2S74_001877 [Evansella vedderi]|uniref:MSP7-like protein n=1 Tax=Evansella vedderi TaxID=38282 RepID=A0ABT9ZVL0_9BACI|nr:hypothetical protein [Evansella vedderi]MDQ0254498.1 hypothetical protein [Evansella vedderi]